jgi:putative RecB family exonuclease
MIAAVDSIQVPSPAQGKPKVIVKANPIETLQKTVSASRLNCWLGCRLKFYFRYVQQISKPKTPSLHIGSVVHLILQAWNMSRWRKQEFQLEKFRKLFEEGWKDQPPGINWEGEEAGEKNTAWSVLEMYFSQTPIKANEMPEAVEVPMETDLSKHSLPTLIGVLDLVRAGGRIVDFKSTGKTPNPEDAAHQNETQLSCYSVLYREATGHRESGRELHHRSKRRHQSW